MKTAVFAGIGRLGVPIVEGFVRGGNKAVISFRKSRTSEKTANDLALRLGRENVMPVPAEISHPGQAHLLMDTAIREYGKIDILINIASGFPGPEEWQKWKYGQAVTEDDWSFYKSNFMTARNCSCALLEKAKNKVVIVNFSDARSLVYYQSYILDPYTEIGGIIIAEIDQIKEAGLAQLEGLAPDIHRNPYTLAKRDIAYLTCAMAVEYSAAARVCGVAPGPILPSENSTEKMQEKVIQETLLKRWGQTGPVTAAVRFLIDNDFITGQTLKVDGGQFLFHKFCKKQ